MLVRDDGSLEGFLHLLPCLLQRESRLNFASSFFPRRTRTASNVNTFPCEKGIESRGQRTSPFLLQGIVSKTESPNIIFYICTTSSDHLKPFPPPTRSVRPCNILIPMTMISMPLCLCARLSLPAHRQASTPPVVITRRTAVVWQMTRNTETERNNRRCKVSFFPAPGFEAGKCQSFCRRSGSENRSTSCPSMGRESREGKKIERKASLALYKYYTSQESCARRRRTRSGI